MPESDFEQELVRLLTQAQVNAERRQIAGAADALLADFMMAALTAFTEMRDRQEARYAALHGVGTPIFGSALPT
jgi:hypothetical protein